MQNISTPKVYSYNNFVLVWQGCVSVNKMHTSDIHRHCCLCDRVASVWQNTHLNTSDIHYRWQLYQCDRTYVNGSFSHVQGDSQQVNLAAYQAFAMQQRALLQQALTYESYLQKAAVGGGQSAQLFHHTQGMGGAGTSPVIGPCPADPTSSPRSPLKLEQVSKAYSLPVWFCHIFIHRC